MASYQGYTALHIAASHGHLETTRVLLKYGAGLTYECEGSFQRPSSQIHMLMRRAHVTVLHIAAARTNVPMCRAILQAHASSDPFLQPAGPQQSIALKSLHLPALFSILLGRLEVCVLHREPEVQFL